ncbi:hypothetical protein [Rhodopirellula baltica]
MMPTPSHLSDCIRRPSADNDEEPLVAPVACPCGSEQFTFLYPGQTAGDADNPYPVVATIDGKYFLVLRAACECGQSHLLLDADLHGWNGYVCRAVAQASLPRPDLVPWSCVSCGGTTHKLTVRVSTHGEIDFAEETDGEFPPETWPDGFSWFSLDTECVDCGHTSDSLIDYETM